VNEIEGGMRAVRIHDGRRSQMPARSFLIAAQLVIAAATLPTAGAAYVGPNGGSGSASANCVAGTVDRCYRTWTYTSPGGATWSGRAAAAVGPYRGVAARSVTTPSGTTWYRWGGWRR
jgi:hypothetical protein